MRQQRTSMAAAAALSLVLGLAGCAGAAEPDEPAPPATPGDSGSSAPGDSGSTSDESSATGRGADLATTQFALSWQDAVDQAMADFDGRLAEIELDWARDRYAYTVELVSDTEEYKVRIDADTGEKYESRTEQIEADDLAEAQAEVVDLDAIVSWDEALVTALDAQQGTVNEWKLEGTERGPQYQFDIDDDAGEDYGVTIDAVSGALVEIDD